MESKKLDKSWQVLTTSICDDYPGWFSSQLHATMQHVFTELEGIGTDTDQYGREFFAYEDMFELASNRYQLLKDLENGFSLFESRDDFKTMDPAQCAREIIGMR